MDLERLINGALIGALVGVGISATSDATRRITQHHLKGYDNLDPDGANLAFQAQSEFGEEATKRLITRMNALATLAAVMDAGNDIDTNVVLAAADRAHHVHDRIKSHVNNLISADTESATSKTTLSQILEWAQCHASNIDVLLREKAGVTSPPVPCEFEERAQEDECVKEKDAPPQPTGLMGLVGSLMSNMFAKKT